MKQGDAFVTITIDFVLEYAIRKVQKTNLGLDMNGTHQVFAYADDVNLTGDDIGILESPWECNIEPLSSISHEVN